MQPLSWGSLLTGTDLNVPEILTLLRNEAHLVTSGTIGGLGEQITVLVSCSFNFTFVNAVDFFPFKICTDFCDWNWTVIFFCLESQL